MNIDVLNIGKYRVSSYGGRSYSLYNTENGVVLDLNATEYNEMKAKKNEGFCEAYEIRKNTIIVND